MEYLFSRCLTLKKLILPNFHYINAIEMSHMFNKCSDELIKKIKEKYKNIPEEAFC